MTLSCRSSIFDAGINSEHREKLGYIHFWKGKRWIVKRLKFSAESHTHTHRGHANKHNVDNGLSKCYEGHLSCKAISEILFHLKSGSHSTHISHKKLCHLNQGGTSVLSEPADISHLMKILFHPKWSWQNLGHLNTAVLLWEKQIQCGYYGTSFIKHGLIGF